MNTGKLIWENDIPVQENFLGVNAIYHAYGFVPDNAGRQYDEEKALLELDRAQKLNLHIARTFYSWYAYENDGSWNWDNDRMKCLYRWLTEAKNRNIDVALNIGWWLTNDVYGKSTDSTAHYGKAPFKVENNWEKSVENFADWACATAREIIVKRGFDNVKYFVMFTEPNMGSFADGRNNREAWLDCVRAVHNKLKYENLRDLVKLVGPNEANSKGPMLKWAVENASEYIDIFSNHWYLLYSFVPDDYSQVRSGKMSVMFSTAGYKVQQKINLKPHTDYTVSVYAKIKNTERKELKGGMFLGAFSTHNGWIEAGGQPTTLLCENSVYHFPAEELIDDGDWHCYKMKFNSGENESGYIGVFNDIKDKINVYYDDVEVYENGKHETLIADGSFELTEDSPWQIFREGHGGPEYDDYDVWYSWAKNSVDCVPSDKGYWFDEYNVNYDERYNNPIHGTNLANSQVAMLNAGVQCSLIWTLFDQIWPNNHTTNSDSFVDGDHRCGLMPNLNRSLKPYPAYYMFAPVMKYMGGEGTRVFAGKGTTRLHMTGTVQPNGTVTLLVVNSGKDEAEIEISFKKATKLLLHRHLCNPEDVVPEESAVVKTADKDFSVTDKLTDTLPAYSVAVYTTEE